MKFLEERAALQDCSLFKALETNLENEIFKGTKARELVALVERHQSATGNVSETLAALMDESGYEAMLRTEGAQARLDNLSELKNGICQYEESCGEECGIGDYLSHEIQTPKIDTNAPEFDEAEKAIRAKIKKILNVKGTKPVDELHKKLGTIMWEYVGMARNDAGLRKALKGIEEVREEFWKDVRVPGENTEFNQELEKAIRLIDFLDIAKLIALDALNRTESCGGHFREESQTETGEAKRDDENFMYVSAWEYRGEKEDPVLHKEPLNYETIKVQTRNYKD